MPGNYGKYIEPFLGGGALFFAAQPEKAILIDANYELIAAYTAVRDNCKRLITELAKYSYDKNRYYEVREWDKKNNFSRLSVIKRAGRLIFLNKTCFNGLYRVNSQGHFNVPFGRYSNPRILDKDNLLLCSKALKQAQIIHGSYGMAAKKAKKNDFVYFDPQYAALSKTSSFSSYTLG